MKTTKETQLVPTGIAGELVFALRLLEIAVDKVEASRKPDRIGEIAQRVSPGARFPDVTMLQDARARLRAVDQRLGDVLRLANPPFPSPASLPTRARVPKPKPKPPAPRSRTPPVPSPATLPTPEPTPKPTEAQRRLIALTAIKAPTPRSRTPWLEPEPPPRAPRQPRRGRKR